MTPDAPPAASLDRAPVTANRPNASDRDLQAKSWVGLGPPSQPRPPSPLSLHLSLSLFLQSDIYVYIFVYVYIYIYPKKLQHMDSLSLFYKRIPQKSRLGWTRIRLDGWRVIKKVCVCIHYLFHQFERRELVHKLQIWNVKKLI